MNEKRLSALLATLFVVLGVVLRLAGYFSCRALWSDEVYVALNLRFRDYLGLFQPLDYEQTMPVALLLGTKLVVNVLGFSDYTLRLIPLISGCLSLIILRLTFVRFLDKSVAVIAIGLAALWKPLIYYSSELKQYSLDALVTAVTLFCAFKLLSSTNRLIWHYLIAWGILALLLSQPAIFVLAGVAVSTVLDRRFRSSREWRVCCAVASGIWLAEFAALFQFSYRHASESPYMRSFWNSNFLPLNAPDFPHRLSNAAWTVLGSREFVHMRFLVLAALIAAGLYGVWKAHGAQLAAVALAPFAFLFGAAVLKQYPITDRLILFTVPLLFWMYASGVRTMATLIPERFRRLALLVLAAAILCPMSVRSIEYAYDFPLREAPRQVIAQMNATDPVSPVYLAFSKYAQWAYYTSDWKQPNALKEKIDRVFSSGCCAEITYQGVGSRRTEVVGRRPDFTEISEEQWAVREADRIAELHSEYVWIFVPVYNEELRQRKVLEKLFEKLQYYHGSYPVAKYVIGETIAYHCALHPIMPLPQRRHVSAPSSFFSAGRLSLLKAKAVHPSLLLADVSRLHLASKRREPPKGATGMETGGNRQFGSRAPYK